MSSGVLRRLPKFTCFLVNDVKGKKLGRKSAKFTCWTDFALISTIFIRWVCNFTQSTTMYTKLFRILLTNVRKCLEKILFTRRTESSVSSENISDSLRRVKCIFSKHFWTLVNKIRKSFVYIVVLCVNLQKFLPFKSLTKKHVNLGNLPRTPEDIFKV